MKFRAQLSWAWKKFYNLGARSEQTEESGKVPALQSLASWICMIYQNIGINTKKGHNEKLC